MSGHTPGPWKAQTSGEWSATHDGYGIGSYEAVCGVDGFVVALATAYRSDLSVRPDPRANARLIAAAPELLEALILLEREMVESGNAGSVDYGWKPAIEKTRAAIAKATGAAS